MKTRNFESMGWDLCRLERWLAVQLLLPRANAPPDQDYDLLPHFEASWREFLDDLPANLPMNTAEFAKLAFFAGACSSFAGLAQHDKDSAALHLNAAEDRAALEDFASEPMEYLRVRGIKLP